MHDEHHQPHDRSADRHPDWDSRTTAQTVARTRGIERVEAEGLPAQKGEVITHLQAEGRVVAMAGDGVNDAPALAQAHGGIALGRGTEVAMENAGVALVQGDLQGMVRARRLSQGTMQNSRQNLVLACIDHTLGGPIAAGVLSPVCGLLRSPMPASAAMTCSSVSVMGHALRLRRRSLVWGGTGGALRRCKGGIQRPVPRSVRCT